MAACRHQAGSQGCEKTGCRGTWRSGARTVRARSGTHPTWYRKWRRGRAEAIQFDGKNPACSQVGCRKCKKNLTCVGESYTFMILARCLSRAYLQLFIPVTLSEILTSCCLQATLQENSIRHKPLMVQLIMYLARNVLQERGEFSGGIPNTDRSFVISQPYPFEKETSCVEKF